MRTRTALSLRLSALWLAAFLTACGSATPAAPQVDVPATDVPATLAPAATATPAAPPTETPVPMTPTPTTIVLSATDRDDVLKAFKAMALAEVSAKVMLRSATTALAEADSAPFQAGIRMLTAAALVGQLDDTLEKVTPPITLAPFWGETIAGVGEMKELLIQWTNQELKVSEIEALMPPIIERMSAAVDNAQTALVLLYAWDPAELEAARQDMLAREDSFFMTATPTP